MAIVALNSVLTPLTWLAISYTEKGILDLTRCVKAVDVFDYHFFSRGNSPILLSMLFARHVILTSPKTCMKFIFNLETLEIPLMYLFFILSTAVTLPTQRTLFYL